MHDSGADLVRQTDLYRACNSRDSEDVEEVPGVESDREFVARVIDLDLFHCLADIGIRRHDLERSWLQPQFHSTRALAGEDRHSTEGAVQQLAVDARTALALFRYHLPIIRKLTLDEPHEELDA